LSHTPHHTKSPLGSRGRDKGHMPSVCHLSSVTFLHPAQWVELFSNILHHLIPKGLGQFLLKFWKKIRRGCS